MFETQLPMAVKSVKVKLDPNDGAPIRLCTLTLACEFDSVVAGGLGGDAREALELLESGGMQSCILPIDRILVEARLVALEKAHTLKNLKGVKATAKAGDDDKAARVELEFAFSFEKEAWCFLGEHVGIVAAVTFRKMQLELAGAERPSKRRGAEA